MRDKLCKFRTVEMYKDYGIILADKRAETFSETSDNMLRKEVRLALRRGEIGEGDLVRYVESGRDLERYKNEGNK